MEIIALDLSLNSTGYAVVHADKEEESFDVVEKGLIEAKRGESHHEKLTRTLNALKRLKSDYPDAVVVKEQLHFGRKKVMSILAKVHGVTDLVFPEIREIYPATVKKQVCGNGHANKQEVADAVYKHLKLTEDELTFQTDDESDAVAVAIAHVLG